MSARIKTPFASVESESFGFSCILLLILWLICGMLWPYTINTWLVFFDKEPVILLWHGMILAIVPILGKVTIPAAVITWILMLFLS